MQKTPGVDSTSGSLGNGVSIGLGMTLAARVNRQDYFTYVIVGDGEIQEGIIWEAAMRIHISRSVERLWSRARAEEPDR
jgi:transketolase